MNPNMLWLLYLFLDFSLCECYANAHRPCGFNHSQVELQKLTDLSPAWSAEVEELKQDFREMDRNGDGNVDLRELQKEMGKTKKGARKEAVKFLHEVGEVQKEVATV